MHETSKRPWLNFVAVFLVLAGGSVSAKADDAQSTDFGSLSGNLVFGSNYMFRGISQTRDEPQVQGDVTWTHGSGLYLGLWASNTEAGGEGNSMELDPFIGFSRPIGDTGFVFDVGFWYYSFPGSNADLDYWELYGTVAYDVEAFRIEGRLWYADNYFGDDFFPDTSALASAVVLTYRLPRSFSVSGRLGRQMFDEAGGLRDQDYTYYDLGVSYTWRKLTLDLRWHDALGVESELARSEYVGALVGSLKLSF